jgi:serine/threonine protein kinase/Tol biopolymer transport system component
MPATLERLRAALAGRYEIEKEIGAGGMATVFLARDVKHQRSVALKVLRPELGAVLGADRFLAEIRTTANLQHPNILPLFDSGEADGLLFYVMPFVQGETLRARLTSEKQLPIEEAVRIAVAVAGALQYAHEHGVIHRDLKPENILLQSGQPVIADFGIALAVTKAAGARITQTGISLGTPQYMSPEQATGDRTIDGRSDIYSLGAVTYEMLAGEPPHHGSSAQAIIAKLMTSEPAPVEYFRPTVPENVASAIDKSLAKLPADRFASAGDFAQALTNPSFRIRTRTGVAAKFADQEATSARWKRFAIAASAAAAVLLATTLWLTLKPAPPKPVIRYSLQLDSTNALSPEYNHLAISPDGMTVVYAGGAEPNQRLFVRRRNEFSATPLAGTEGARFPFFSADGKRVGYSTNTYDLKVVSLAGGDPVTIADSIVDRGQGSWGPDGFIYTGARAGAEILRLRPEAGAVIERVTSLDNASREKGHYFPTELPNGKGVLFFLTYGPGPKPDAVAIVNLSTRKHRILFDGAWPRYSPSGHIVYKASDGTLMAIPFDQGRMRITGDAFPVTSGPTGGRIAPNELEISASGTLIYLDRSGGDSNELVWVTRDGRAEIVDSSWHGPFGAPTLSPDGTRLAVSRGGLSGGNSIWIKQLDHGPALKMTSERNNSNFPAWTPDGKSLSYNSDVMNPYKVWLKPADGSGEAKEMPTTENTSESVWSPDGKWLIFRTSVSGPGKGDILAIRPGVDSSPLRLLASNYSEQEPAFSPDGRWLAYCSNETGRNEIYVVPFPNSTAGKWPVSSQGGNEPVWAHNGHELFYRDGSGRLVTVAVSLTPTFSSGEPKVLFPANDYFSSTFHQQYTVSRDDRRFLMIRPITSRITENRIMVVDNWFEELKSMSNR